LLKPGGLCTAAGNGGGVFIVRLEPGVGALPGGARGRGEACSGRGRGEGRRTAGAARCSAAAVLPPAWFGGDQGRVRSRGRRGGRLEDWERFFFFEGWKTGRDVYTNALIRLLFRWAEFYLD